MNTVKVKINSYLQTAQLFINGQEPSPYSELANFSYKQYLQNPGEILEAVARELNDDFSLSVLGNPFEVLIFTVAAERNEYCSACTVTEMPFRLSSQKRAERLGGLLPPNTFPIHIGNARFPEEIPYGNIRLCSTDSETDASVSGKISEDKLMISYSGVTVAIPERMLTPEIAVFACETLLINPHIGRAVATLNDPTPEIAVCARLEPLVSADLPDKIEGGTRVGLTVTVHPAGCQAPDITVVSSNPDIISVDGRTLVAAAPGPATIQAYISGENKPFFSKDIVVNKTILASKLQIVGLDDILHEGAAIPLRVTVTPADAVDADRLTWDTSDPSVASVKDSCLHIHSAGSCKVKVSASACKTEITITAVPKLRRLKISDAHIETSVGHKIPVSVVLEPANAYNTEYVWRSSDESVAVVENAGNTDVIKAVGIGECELTCSSQDGQITDKCRVTVESMMYKNKSFFASPWSVLLYAVLAYLLYKLLSG